MKQLFRAIGVFVCLTSLTFCVNTPFQTNKDQNYTSQLTKVLVVVDVQDLKMRRTVPVDEKTAKKPDYHEKWETFMLGDYLRDSIRDRLTQKGIEVQAVAIGALELNDTKVDEIIKQFEPKEILSVSISGSSASQHYQYSKYGGYTVTVIGNDFDLTITDVGLASKVWRAKTSIETGTDKMLTGTYADKMIATLFAGLVQDGLLK